MKFKQEWVLISSTGKIFDGCIRDLGFNPRLHQKTNWYLGLMIKSYHQEQEHIYTQILEI